MLKISCKAVLITVGHSRTLSLQFVVVVDDDEEEKQVQHPSFKSMKSSIHLLQDNEF